MIENFVVFILTYGRPDKVVTYNTLRKAGYSGKIILICSDDDNKLDQYKDKFGKDNILVFNKNKIAKTFDSFDNFEDKRCIIYARNYCFEAAKKLGYKYFIQLDDDYTKFDYRINNKGEIPENKWIVRKNLDKIFELLLEFYKKINAKSIAIAQGGDFIGGHELPYKLKRKAMNSFICSTERPFKFIGRINEDVNTYTSVQSKGNLFFTIPYLKLDQLTTQSNSGGMADMYLDTGTYLKSFYTVICSPSSVSIRLMGSVNKRLHHHINWNKTAPKIVSEEIKIK